MKKILFFCFYERGSDMKLVKVIMRPEKKFALKDVLADMGCHGITTKECSGFGENKETIREIYNGRVYEQRTDVSNQREEVEFVVPDDKVKKVLENVKKVADDYMIVSPDFARLKEGRLDEFAGYGMERIK